MNSSRTTFFRQSGWMVAATIASGFFMFAVNLVANRMDSSEFTVFRTLLAIFLLMSFPAVGLQVIFAEQTSAAIGEADRRRLAQTIRSVLRGTFLLWLGIALVMFFCQRTLITSLNITNPAALWFTILVGLSSLWLPILRGLLQGGQNFLALGSVAIFDGFGRFVAVAMIVLLGGQAAGGMAGASLGQLVAVIFGFWMTRALWRGAGEPVPWANWFRRVVPITAAYSAVLLLTCADVILVGSVYPTSQAQYYVAAQIIGVALVTLTTPVAMVMFPKIVASAALAHRTDALQLALGATALIAGAVALACTLLPELPLRILFFRKPEFWKSATLVPWFAWALVPLVLTNVLVNNLIARGRLAVAPWLAAVGAGYGITLLSIRERLLQLEMFTAFKTLIGTLGVFSLLLLAIALAFTWRTARAPNPGDANARSSGEGVDR